MQTNSSHISSNYLGTVTILLLVAKTCGQVSVFCLHKMCFLCCFFLFRTAHFLVRTAQKRDVFLLYKIKIDIYYLNSFIMYRLYIRKNFECKVNALLENSMLICY